MKTIILVPILLFLALVIVIFLFLNVSRGCPCCAGGYSEGCCHYDAPDCITKERFFSKYDISDYESCMDYGIKEYWDIDCKLVDGHRKGEFTTCCASGFFHIDKICKEKFGCYSDHGKVVCPEVDKA